MKNYPQTNSSKFLILFLALLVFACDTGTKEKIANQSSENNAIVDDKREHEADSFESEKKVYKKLALLVLNPGDQTILLEFADTMSNYSDDPNYFTNLNYILDFVEINNIPFLIRKNEDNGGFDSTVEVTEFMKKNFNVDVDLSSASEKHEWNDFDCTVESDRLLRGYGFQYGFINTQSDENIKKHQTKVL